MDYIFDRPKSNKISKEKILEELERVAGIFGYQDFSYREFDQNAKISADTARVQFGSWIKAKEALKDVLKQKGLELKDRKFRQQFSEKELFNEMERVWNILGHRPSAREWECMDTKISSTTYQDRFDGWSNACLKFIEYKMGHVILTDYEIPITKNDSLNDKQGKIKVEKDTRTIPLGLRLKVLDRDNFRCRFCGRSPATEMGVQLHIDHIFPHSKGGKTSLENLQTLCKDCNLGKSNQNVGNAMK